jgi:hypothetical protein
MAAGGIDIVGDIHGMHTRLVAMLDALGYRRAAGRWTHAESRKIVFVGDYVDRGARVAEVVELVRELCDHRVALALAGNHDTNAIAFATRAHHCAHDRAFDAAAAWRQAMARLAAGPDAPPAPNAWLRPHDAKNLKQHQDTVRGFADAHGYDACVRHFMTLPLYLELPGLRAVHAAWIPPAIRALDAWAAAKGVTAGIRANSIDEAIEIQQFRAAPDERHWGELLDLGARQQALDFAPDESVAIALERIVKGVEMRLPGDVRLADGGGHARGEMRIRWFDAAAGRTYHEHALTKAADAAKLRALLGERRIDVREHPAELPLLETLVPYHPHDAYPADERCVFFGHYALFDAADRAFGKILRANVACVDHGGGYRDGSLSAYRWSGERELRLENFVTADAKPD